MWSKFKKPWFCLIKTSTTAQHIRRSRVRRYTRHWVCAKSPKCRVRIADRAPLGCRGSVLAAGNGTADHVPSSGLAGRPCTWLEEVKKVYMCGKGKRFALFNLGTGWIQNFFFHSITAIWKKYSAIYYVAERDKKKCFALI